MVYIYIVTIRKSQVLDFVSYSSLKDRIRALSEYLPNMRIKLKGFEAHGMYRQLHVHMMVYSSKKINYRKVNKKFYNDGFIYHFELCTINSCADMQRICDYISKNDRDQHSRREILIYNYYRYHNGFEQFEDQHASVPIY